MVENLVTSMAELLQSLNLPKEFIPFIISLLPVLELRGGMIAARLLQINMWEAFAICYVGNLLPIPFILLFIRKIFSWMSKFPFMAKIVKKFEIRSEKKKQTVLKYKQLGLLLLVAIPLPGTGGWTGALVAALMDIRLKKSLPIIAIGVLAAGIIMAAITYGIFGKPV